VGFATCLGFASMYSITLWGHTSTQVLHSQQLANATTSFIICLKVTWAMWPVDVSGFRRSPAF